MAAAIAVLLPISSTGCYIVLENPVPASTFGRARLWSLLWQSLMVPLQSAQLQNNPPRHLDPNFACNTPCAHPLATPTVLVTRPQTGLPPKKQA